MFPIANTKSHDSQYSVDYIYSTHTSSQDFTYQLKPLYSMLPLNIFSNLCSKMFVLQQVLLYVQVFYSHVLKDYFAFPHNNHLLSIPEIGTKIKYNGDSLFYIRGIAVCCTIGQNLNHNSLNGCGDRFRSNSISIISFNFI